MGLQSWTQLGDFLLGFPYSPVGKESASNAGDLVVFSGREGPLEEEMAAHSSLLAWEIPWTEEPGATVHGVTKSWTRLKQLSWYPVAVSSPGPLH